MSALFDSNIVIDLLAGYPQALAEAAKHKEAAISRITWMEVLIGADNPATQAMWESFLRQFEVIELDESVCREAIKLRQDHRLKLPDAIILASTRISGMNLVTRNTRDFKPDMEGVRFPYT